MNHDLRTEDQTLNWVQAYENVCSRAVSHLDRRAFDERREGYLALFAAFPLQRSTVAQYQEELLVLESHSIRFRIYRTDKPSRPEVCLIYAHGGGFVSGNLDICDGLAREFADDLGVTVVTFDYRLSPEYPYPAPLDDCFSIVTHLQDNAPSFGINPTSILFSGESCGGNFAPAVAMLLRDRGKQQLAGQIPLNPVFNVHRWAKREVSEGSEGFQAEMQYFTSNYLGAMINVYDAYASPLLAANLVGMPPAFIWAAGQDPLRNEAIEFSDKLNAAGVRSVLRIKPGVVHGCIRARHYYPFAEEVYKEVLDGISNLIVFLFASYSNASRLEVGK